MKIIAIIIANYFKYKVTLKFYCVGQKKAFLLSEGFCKLFSRSILRKVNPEL